MHISVICKKKESILLLMDYGADPNKLNEKGKTALQLMETYFPEFKSEFEEMCN